MESEVLCFQMRRKGRSGDVTGGNVTWCYRGQSVSMLRFGHSSASPSSEIGRISSDELIISLSFKPSLPRKNPGRAAQYQIWSRRNSVSLSQVLRGRKECRLASQAQDDEVWNVRKLGLLLVSVWESHTWPSSDIASCASRKEFLQRGSDSIPPKSKPSGSCSVRRHRVARTTARCGRFAREYHPGQLTWKTKTPIWIREHCEVREHCPAKGRVENVG
jgi:hypothetical protein